MIMMAMMDNNKIAEVYNKIAEVYNNNKQLVNDVIKKKLGVEVDMVIDNGVYIEDAIKTDVDKKMRGNKILRSLFENIYLYGSFCYYEDEHNMFVNIGVRYTHPSGGSNGRDLLTFWIDTEKGKVIKIK